MPAPKKITTSGKPTLDLPPGMSRSGSPAETAEASAPPTAMEAHSPDEMLLVCLQDPFEGIGQSWSKIVNADVDAVDADSDHVWRLQSALELNVPRFFESWATRGTILLDLTVSAQVAPKDGAWGGNESVTSASEKCRITVMRDDNHKILFSLTSGTEHPSEKPMVHPEPKRFFNADVAFEINGTNGLTAAAVAVISEQNWSRLIAGSSVATKGLAFDGGWRSHLGKSDGDCVAQGAWAFAAMSLSAYRAICATRSWSEHIVD